MSIPERKFYGTLRTKSKIFSFLCFDKSSNNDWNEKGNIGSWLFKRPIIEVYEWLNDDQRLWWTIVVIVYSIEKNDVRICLLGSFKPTLHDFFYIRSMFFILIWKLIYHKCFNTEKGGIFVLFNSRFLWL